MTWRASQSARPSAIARYVIQRTSSHYFLSQAAPYDVASKSASQVALSFLQRNLNPRFLSSVAFYDVASEYVCQALYRGRP